MHIFSEDRLDQYLSGVESSLGGEVSCKDDEYILNVNEDEFVRYLVDRYEVDNLALDFEGQSMSTSERSVPAERHPSSRFILEAGQSYTREIIKLHIPFSGNDTLFRMAPTSRLMWHVDVNIEANCLTYEIINFYSEADSIKQEIATVQRNIIQQLQNVNTQVDAFNASLESIARKQIAARRQKADKKAEMVTALGIPLKTNEDLPKTFSVPTTPKKIKVSFPEVSRKTPEKPEPTLEKEYYDQILEVVHDTGKQIERTPSVHIGKHEEDLRDYFLLMLEPRFDGSATGETFNKKGKTDILIRYEGKNLFVAEYKIWSGPKSFSDAIDQLLNYLTWRDSKTALVFFVKNKDFSNVLAKIKSEIEQHEEFDSMEYEKDETWLGYKLCLPGDKDRKVFCSVMVFHIPE